ncbi:unnamed protein product [Dibothriocephalus latus]|uniref:Cas1p 10 TM acyl transferase domain-containing protein n=1 Tax=Dibothriocephalus latus TaxID=60516 RepID=A0A3P7LSA5_DIBLA|nr:unnamed protein product [Dibothriocephalus latus]
MNTVELPSSSFLTSALQAVELPNASLLLKVLFRMNILVVLLCVVFRQPYMKYYFVPLITTAYTLSAATMTAWILLLSFVESSCCQRLKSVPVPASNWALIRRIKATRDFVETYRKDICFLLVLSAAFLYSHLLQTSSGLFSFTFFKSPLKYLFGPATGQWKYRWSIDGYSTVLGLAIGYAVSKWKEFRQQEQNHESSLEKDILRPADYYRIPKLILTCLTTTGSSVALIVSLALI